MARTWKNFYTDSVGYFLISLLPFSSSFLSFGCVFTLRRRKSKERGRRISSCSISSTSRVSLLPFSLLYIPFLRCAVDSLRPEKTRLACQIWITNDSVLFSWTCIERHAYRHQSAILRYAPLDLSLSSIRTSSSRILVGFIHSLCFSMGVGRTFAPLSLDAAIQQLHYMI